MKGLSTILQVLLGLVLLTGLAGCVEPYAPDIIDAPPSLLVVEGFINAGGPTTIRLSRTASLNDQATPPPEAGARLLIEQQNGGNFILTEISPGIYVSAQLKLPAGSLCRLRITTVRGQQYASDFVPVKLTPPIDEVRFTTENNTANILVNTHDDTGASQYYRWEFDETWEVRPLYYPSIEYYNRSIIPIRVPYPTVCWGSFQSSRILLSQTTALSQDVVSNFRVQGIAAEETRLFVRYSILVRQQTLTKEGYAYWEQLKKNTESIGSLFDPQPSQVAGNVRGLTDPNEMALGFVSAHSVAEKRLFISRRELPAEWRIRSGYEGCAPPDTVFIVPRGDDKRIIDPQKVIDQAFGSMTRLPINPYEERGVLQGYTAKNRDCVDCRTRGTAVRPSFW